MNKEDYYINLLLERCISLKRSKSVFISYSVYNEEFVQKLINRLEEKGVKDIYLECIDPFYEHELLKKMSLKEIEDSEYFDASIYNDYAKKKAAFVFFVSPVPGIFNDIDDEKLALVSRIKSTTKKYFVEKEVNDEISWTIVPLYNEYWEKELGINNLEKVLYQICQIDKNYQDNWNKQLSLLNKVKNNINKLQLDYLKYETKKGTNLKIGLPKNYKFGHVGDAEVLVNMPSYEIYTSPDRNVTEGIVYSTRPLLYNGSVIDDFYLEFKEGKVISYFAKKGNNILKSIIDFDEGSSFLGEVALVEHTSPISKTGLIFKTTLLDENASCHLALGRGFGKGNKTELLKRGINVSDIHVDFMVGSADLNITGYKDGKAFPIMKNGKFVI